LILRLSARILKGTTPRLLWRFLVSFAWKGARAVRAYERRRRQGIHVPAFFFLSITNRCNLRCVGCWVDTQGPPQDLPLESMERIVRECKAQGSHFFGLLGGEPLLHPDLFTLIERHPDCYFQVFTNGTLLTAEIAQRLQRLGNVTPLVSIEGREDVSDERRGGTRVYARALEGLAHCRAARLITGVATSICQNNIDDLASEAFLDELIARGVHYVWYYIYRPVGAHPAPELALDREQILRLRRFLVEMRRRKPILIVDAYWDAEGRALCPAAVGISHHVNPQGDLEPCPPIQFADANALAADGLATAVRDSRFLTRFRALAASRTRGCILLEDPAALAQIARDTGARDTSGRDSYAELARACPCQSHHLSGEEIPEAHWLYRLAKRNWFWGFGAYG